MGYFGYFRTKIYFDNFEAFRGTFTTLEVYGYFGHFLAILDGWIVSMGLIKGS